MKNPRITFALYMICSATLLAQTSYPDLPNVTKPNPEPAFPSGFDAFSPPVSTNAPAVTAPVVAEWTKIGGPDSVIPLTGSRLSSYTGTQAGMDTQFEVFGQGASGSYLGAASIMRLDGQKAAVILPASLPVNSEYFIWPVNSAGAGSPVAVNATDAWWIGPNVATRGDTVSVYGRNLAHQGVTVTSHIYIQQSGSTGVWATVTSANPYKVDFTVPTSLANGTYQVWVHNGHGGHYGWSGPLVLTINNGMPWTTQQFNVKNYGAKGDGVTDDEAAIEAAMVAASKYPWSTVYLPTGTYMVSSGFNMPSQVRWMGDGATKTFIKANAGFVKPVQDDPRRYCLFYSNWSVNNVTFENMTIDANGHMNGVLNAPVWMQSDSDIRFINVTINGKGYATADFSGSTRLSFQNCAFIGGGNGIFFGSATQISINGCQVYGTNDVNTMLTFWGGDSISCTNTTAQDYNDAETDGWAQGRFFYGCTAWGSNRNIYVGNNRTIGLEVRPGYANQNTGEQIGWEDGTVYSAVPTSATATTVTFPSNSIFSNAALLAGGYDAVIVNGTGLGQHRRIVSVAGSTITVSPPWNVPPDNSSTLTFAGVVAHCVVYDNTIQGKSDYATRDTASVGIQPYGNSFDFVADGNHISQVRNGIYLWGMGDSATTPETIDCAYFDYVANNTISNCENGINGISQAWNGWPVSDPYPGLSFFGNTIVNNMISSMSESGMSIFADCPPAGDQFELTVFDHNSIASVPTGINLNQDSPINNSIAYKNSFSLGSARGSGSVGIDLKANATPALRLNSYSGFAQIYGSASTPAAVIEAPSHVVTVQGTAGGAPVLATLALWNAGTGTLTWQAANAPSWLSVTQSGGSISNEDDAAKLTMTCSPKGLTAGLYTDNVTVNVAGQIRTYSVNFNVTK